MVAGAVPIFLWIIFAILKYIFLVIIGGVLAFFIAKRRKPTPLENVKNIFSKLTNVATMFMPGGKIVGWLAGMAVKFGIKKIIGL